MDDLLIRNLPPETHKALKKLAAERDTTIAEVAADFVVRGTGTGPERMTREIVARLRASAEAAPRLPYDWAAAVREDRDARDRDDEARARQIFGPPK